MEVSLKRRNKTFDLIRVIAIFAIICGHMYTFANFNDVLATDTSVQFYLSHFLKAIGLVENNIFFLITGVYSVSSDYKKALNKVVSLYIKIYVVSVLCFVFFTIVWHIPINIDSLCITFAPFSMNGYLFLSVFITVLLLSPFVNAAWNIIERKYALAVYGIFFILIVLIPSILGEEKVINGGEYSVAFGVLLFITGKIIGEYGEKFKSLKFTGWGYMLLLVVAFLYNTVVKVQFGEIKLIDRMMDGSNKLIPFLLSVLIISFAMKQTTIFKSAHINRGVSLIAKSSLMIYIVHCNKYFIRFVFPAIRTLWEKTEIPYIIYVLGVSLLILFLLTALNIMVEWIEARLKKG